MSSEMSSVEKRRKYQNEWARNKRARAYIDRILNSTAVLANSQANNLVADSQANNFVVDTQAKNFVANSQAKNLVHPVVVDDTCDGGENNEDGEKERQGVVPTKDQDYTMAIVTTKEEELETASLSPPRKIPAPKYTPPSPDEYIQQLPSSASEFPRMETEELSNTDHSDIKEESEILLTKKQLYEHSREMLKADRRREQEKTVDLNTVIGAGLSKTEDIYQDGQQLLPDEMDVEESEPQDMSATVEESEPQDMSATDKMMQSIERSLEPLEQKLDKLLEGQSQLMKTVKMQSQLLKGQSQLLEGLFQLLERQSQQHVQHRTPATPWPEEKISKQGDLSTIEEAHKGNVNDSVSRMKRFPSASKYLQSLAGFAFWANEVKTAERFNRHCPQLVSQIVATFAKDTSPAARKSSLKLIDDFFYRAPCRVTTALKKQANRKALQEKGLRTDGKPRKTFTEHSSLSTQRSSLSSQRSIPSAQRSSPSAQRSSLSTQHSSTSKKHSSTSTQSRTPQ